MGHGAPRKSREPPERVGTKLRGLICILIFLCTSFSVMHGVFAVFGDEHDIAVEDIELPLYTAPGIDIEINATIWNIGINSEGDIRVNLLVNGSIQNFTTLTILQGGDFEIVKFLWNSTFEGLYKIGIKVEPVDNETDLSNNLLEDCVVVTSGVKEGKVGLISSGTELSPISWILDEMAVPYDLFINNEEHNYILNLSLLLEHKVVVFSLPRGISQDEYDILKAYVDLGGHLLITGYGSLDIYSPLVDLIGTLRFGVGDFSKDFIVMDDTHPMMDGLYGKFGSGSTYKPLAADYNNAKANISVGAVTVAQFSGTGGDDMIISRDIPFGGSATFWNDNGHVDWAGSQDFETMFKNFIDFHIYGTQQHDVMVNEFICPVFSLPSYTHDINATLWNRGTSNELNIVVTLYVNGVPVDSTTRNLDSHQSTQISFSWTAPSNEGIYGVRIVASNMTGETITSNNYVESDILVRTRPDTGKVALISDQSQLAPISFILDEMGIDYDILINNYPIYPIFTGTATYTEDVTLMFGYQTVVMYVNLRYITSKEKDVLTAYTTNGGNLLVTGYFGTNGKSYDKNLAEILGIELPSGQPHFSDNLIVNASSHPIVNGAYGVFARDYTLEGLSPIVFPVEALPGTITVADLSGKKFDKITSLEGTGKAVYWNGDGTKDWVNNHDAQAMFKNFIDWAQFIPQNDYDLWVTLLKVYSRALPEENLTIEATVINRGLQPGTNISVNLSVEGLVIDQVNVPYLEPGLSQEISFHWTNGGEGKYLVEVVAEPLPSENNILNNRISKIVDVYEPIGYILVDLGHENQIYNHNRYLYDLIFKRYWINYTYFNLSSNLLSKHDILLIIGANEKFDQVEIEAVIDFVSQGKGLFVIGGNKGVVEELTAYCGISWYGSSTYNWGSTHYINFHPTTINVEELWHSIPYGSFKLSKNAEALVYDGKNETIQGAVGQHYRGRIIALRSDDWLSDLCIERNDSKIFGRNIIAWLMMGDLVVLDHDVMLTGLEVINFARIGENIFINGTIENLGITDEYDVKVNLTVNGIKVDEIMVPHIPSAMRKMSSYQDVVILNGSVNLPLNITDKTANETLNEANLGISPINDSLTPLSNIRDGMVGDNNAVFFANSTSGPGEYNFRFITPKIVTKLRFYQDDEYLANNYKILADSEGDGIFETLLVEVDDGSGAGDIWVTYEFIPTEVFAIKFLAVSGIGSGSLGPRAFPSMHEFEIYGFDKEYYHYGNLITNIIRPSKVDMWLNLMVNMYNPDLYHYITVSILNGSNFEFIPGYQGIIGTSVDISGIDPNIYPSLRLLVEFISDGSSTPVLYDLNVTWINMASPRWWSEDFNVNKKNEVEVSFLWNTLIAGNYTVGINISQVSDEVRLSNNEISKSITVIKPKGYVLVDMGHSDYNSGYENFYEDIIKLGYWVNYTMGEITLLSLLEYDVLITINPTKGYDDSSPDPEISNITKFVGNGGGLLVVGNYNIALCQELTYDAKIKWVTPSPQKSGTTTNIMPHFISYSIDELQYSGLWALHSLQIFGQAQAVVYDNSDKQMTIQCAASTFNLGHVVALVSYDWFREFYYHRTDNRRFALNIINWLMQNESDHDMSISNLHAENHVLTGDNTEIKATLWNLGSSGESNILVRLKVNGTAIKNKTITSLDAGSSVPISFTWTPAGEGLYNISVEAVPVALENFTENNLKYNEVRVFTPRGYILVDNAHGNDQFFSSFYDYLLSQNFWVNFTVNHVDSAVLSGYDVFITAAPTMEFWSGQNKEISSIQSFVNNGGGLLVIASDSTICNPLLNYAGIDFIESFEYEYGATTNIDPHPTTDGVDVLYPSQSSLALEVRTAAQGIVYDSSHSVIWGAASRYGKGKVIALSGTGWLDDYTLDSNDNKEFGKNIIKWLASPLIINDTSLSNAVVKKYVEPLVTYTFQVTFHNWHTDKTPIEVSMWADGTLCQTQILNITYGTSRVINFTWTAPAVAGEPQHLSINFSIETLPGDDYPANNHLTAEIVVRPIVARLLFDQSHYGDKAGMYSNLIDELEYLGYEVNTTKAMGGMFDLFVSGDPNEPITSLENGKYKALIIPQPLLKYNNYVLSKIQEYVTYGLGLLVIGDDAPNVVQDLTEFAGINWSYGGAPGDTVDITSHGITENVNRVDLQCPMARLETSGNAFDIIRDDDGDTMLAISAKPGRIAAWVDEGSFSNDGINEEDNLNLAINIIKWLTAPGVVTLKNTTGLNAPAKGKAIELIWTPNKEITILGYEIYRNSTSGGDYEQWELIATVGLETKYFDTDVESETIYYYVVRAFDWNTPSQKSNFSNEANATALDFIPPSKPLGLWIESIPTGNALILHWSPNTEPDVQGYLIYRCTDNVSFVLIGYTSSDYYIDTNNNQGLVDNVTYYYKIKAFDGIPNNSTFSDVAVGIPGDIIPPPPPTGLTVTTIMKPGMLRLDWNPSPASDLAGYKIYRSNNSGGPYSLIEDNWALTYFTDSGLKSETVYYYVVKAFDEVPNESSYSMEDWGLTMDSTPPAAPVLLSVNTVPTGRELNITWLPNSEPDLTTYHLFRSEDGISYEWIADIPAGTEYHLDSNLRDGKIYYYILNASDEIPNYSGWSNNITGVPLDSVAPSAPKGLNTRLEGSLTLNISWNRCPETDVTWYWIYYSTDNITFFLLKKVPASRNYTIHPYLTEGATYYYYVAASDEVNNTSPKSMVVNFTIFDNMPPATPTGLAISANGTILFIAWDEVTTNMDGSPCDDFDQYVLYSSTDNITFYVLAILDGSTNTTFLHTGLITDQTYYYKVQAADDVPNYSPNSTVIQGVPRISSDTIAPDKIQNVMVTVIPTGNELNISWDPSIAADFMAYSVKRSEIPGGPYDNKTWITKISRNYWLDTNLMDGKTYYYVITAIDTSLNEGDFSDEANGAPQDTTPPSAPTGLRVTYIGANALLAEWDIGFEHDIAGYSIYRSTSPAGPFTFLTNVTGRATTWYPDVGLWVGTYYYKVLAYDEVPNESNFSNIANFTIVDEISPQAPTNLQIQVLPEGNRLNLTWDPVTLNSDLTPCTDLYEYWIYRGVGTDPPIFLANVSAGTEYYLDKGLTDDVNYYYIIKAIDTTGNPSMPSNKIYGIPHDSIAPAIPTGLNATPELPNRINLRWDLNSDDDITGYRIWRSTTPGGPYIYVNNVTHPQFTFTDKDLEEDTYYYVITAHDEVPNDSDYSLEVMVDLPDLRPPATPKNFSVEVVPTGNELYLHWDPVTKNYDGTICVDLDHYSIYRSLEPYDNFTLLTNISANIENYNDINLMNGVSYYYMITAVDDAGNAYGAAWDFGTPEDTSPPSPPSNVLVLAPPEGSSLLVTWAPCLDKDVVYYNIYRSTNGVNWVKVKQTDDTTYTQYTDTKVINDKIYYYRITAIDDDGKESLPSGGSGAVPMDRKAPNPPTWLGVLPDEKGNTLIITWGWEPIKPGDVAGCYLYRSTDENGLYNRLTSEPLVDTQFIDKGLDDGRTYYYKLTSVDDVPNESPFSMIVNAIPRDTVAPDAPTGLFASALPEGNSINLTWSPNTEKDVEGYSIYRGENPFEMNWVADVLKECTSYLDTEVKDDVIYYYKILAFDEIPNLSPLSSLTSTKPKDTIPPSPPTGLEIMVVPTGNKLKLTWDANTETDLANYSIHRSQDGVSFHLIGYVSADVNEYTDMGLVDGITYYYKILAMDEVPNESEFSETVNGVPEDTTPPSRPEGLTVVGRGEIGSLMLLWIANSEEDILGYRIYRSLDNIYYEFVAEVPGVETVSYIDTGLLDELLYFYRITAIDEVPNESPESDTVGYVPRTIPPTPKGLLVSSPPEGGALNITWDEISNIHVFFYKLYRSTDDRNYELIATIPTGTEYYMDSNLENGAVYYYKVTSSTRARVYVDFTPTDYWYYIESLESTAVGATPYDTTPPGVPTGLKATSVSDGIYLTWEPLGNGENVLYNIYRYYTPDSTGDLIAIGLEGTSWMDYSAKMGQRYYYSVTAVDESNLEGQSSAQVSALWDVSPTDEVLGRPVLEWWVVLVNVLVFLLALGAVFVWMRKRSERDEEVYEAVREMVKEEDKVHAGPYSDAGIKAVSGMGVGIEQAAKEPEELPPPPPETIGEKISELEGKLKNVELTAKLKSLEAIRVIGEAKTSANIAKEIKEKIENKKIFVTKKIDGYIRGGMFPSSMRGRLNELLLGFSTAQLEQFESITKSKVGISIDEAALAATEEDISDESPEETIVQLEDKLKEAETEAKTRSQSALKTIAVAKERAKEAEKIRAELATLKDKIESKVDSCIRLGMFSKDAEDELRDLLMSFTPEQLDRFGSVTKSGPGVRAPTEENLCSTCGSPLKYVEERGEWYCDACGKYQKPEKLEEPTPEDNGTEEPDEDALPPPEDEAETVKEEIRESEATQTRYEGKYSWKELKKMRKSELKNIASELGIASSGSKGELIQRILREKEEDKEEEPPPPSDLEESDAIDEENLPPPEEEEPPPPDD